MNNENSSEQKPNEQSPDGEEGKSEETTGHELEMTRRLTLKDATSILKREALKQYEPGEGTFEEASEVVDDEDEVERSSRGVSSPLPDDYHASGSSEDLSEAEGETAAHNGEAQPVSLEENSVDMTEADAKPSDVDSADDPSLSVETKPNEEEGATSSTPDTAVVNGISSEAEKADQLPRVPVEEEPKEVLVAESGGLVPGVVAEEKAKEETEAAGANRHGSNDDHKSATANGSSSDLTSDEEGVKPPRHLTEEFYYKMDDIVVGAYSTDLPKDIAVIYHSFGFECQKRSNLLALDSHTVMFAAGNVLEIVDLKTRTQEYIKSTTGLGIGAIAVHPSRKYFAVAEKGNQPPIVIYEWPSLLPKRILRGGTQKAYAHLNFSPVRTSPTGEVTGGDKLASVGSAPDFMLTVWDWKQESTILRYKAFSQEVYKVTFSPENEGQLTTSGLGHIRFWKMAHTFTGLKLQGEIGRFGRTEISDICGYVELPDGKVLSGTESGNLLLWDGGLIKVEIAKKGKKPCHQGMIEDVFMEEGELITAAADGFVKMWDFETIDNADITEDSTVFEMEPMVELKVGSDVKLKSLTKAGDESHPTFWFAQDANGAIWRLDVSTAHTRKAPERLLTFHSGAIRGLDLCPNHHLSASTAADGSVCVEAYRSKLLICSDKYAAGGSVLVWAPSDVSPQLSTFLVGFDDGVVRVLRLVKASDKTAWNSKLLCEHVDMESRKAHDQMQVDVDIQLVQAFKPHIKRVTSLAFHQTGSILASASDDCTVFFMSVEADYEPIGFVNTPSPVVSLEWNPSNKEQLLICCHNGSCLEIAAPEKDKVDSSTTYSLHVDSAKTFAFTSIKQRLKDEEKKQFVAKEEKQREQSEDEEEGKDEEAKEDAAETTSKEPPDLMTDEENVPVAVGEDEDEEEIDTTPGSVQFGCYLGEAGQFLLSMDGFDSGYLYHCQFPSTDSEPSSNVGEPFAATTVPSINNFDCPLTACCWSGGYLFAGTQDGAIRVHKVKHKSEGGLHLDSFWSLPMHDSTAGEVTNVKVSYDGRFVLSTGSDGNFFIYEFKDDSSPELPLEPETVANLKHLQAEQEKDMNAVMDIDDPSAYSIEETKQKAEEDRRIRLAEEKKARTRKEIASLRNEFSRLEERNSALPERLRLTKTDFQMDPSIRAELDRQIEEKIATVHLRLAWDTQRSEIALKKLTDKFKAVVEMERVVVHSFDADTEVSSFRVCHLSGKDILSESEIALEETEELDGKAETGLSQAAEENAGGTLSEDSHISFETKKTDEKQLSHAVGKALAVAEERRRKRLARQKEWDELYEAKPDDNYRDPADVARIEYARENMGDFKLKTASDYVVPKEQRVNGEKKRKQLLHLETIIHHHKTAFNKLVFDLRDRKQAIVEKAREKLDELRHEAKSVVGEHKLDLPTVRELQRDEMPERRLEYTSETLYEFKAKRAAEAAAAKAKAADSGGFGGFGGFGDGDEKPAEAPAKSEQVLAIMDEDRELENTVASETTMAELKTEDIADESDITPWQRKRQEEQRMRFEYKMEKVLSELSEAFQNFNHELNVLRHIKHKLNITLKLADLRHITLYEEFLLLKDFEKRENAFVGRLESKEAERKDILLKVADIDKKFNAKKKDIEHLQEKEKMVHTSFMSSLGDNNKFADFLTKVFKKKIKRVKKKDSEDEGEAMNSSDEESDDDYLSSSDDDDASEDGLDDSVCPAGCDKELFDLACQLREQRLDVEEILTEEKKNSEVLRKEVEALKKKAKVVETAVKTAKADIETFQLEKQAKMNELDTVVILHLDQLQHLGPSHTQLKPDLSQCLVFPKHSITQLEKRIDALHEEKAAQRKEQKHNHMHYVQLLKQKKAMQATIGELQEKVNQLMILKFGQLVDLEKLEVATVSQSAEELKEKLKSQQRSHDKELKKYQKALEKKEDHLTETVKENTRHLRSLHHYMQQEKKVAKQLDTRQTSLGGEYGGKSDQGETQRLKELISIQRQEIQRLKVQIMRLTSKTYPMRPPGYDPPAFTLPIIK